MPHINVKMFPGRDDEKKKDLADKLLQCAQEALGCPAEALSVSVEDVAPEDWNRDVGEKIPDTELPNMKLVSDVVACVEKYQ